MFALPDHTIVTLRGRDAIAFAQAQFMSDLGTLADGQWQWSGWLTPKGRTIALFALLRADAQTLHLVLHDTDPMQFAERLQRFVFRSKLAIDTGALQAGGAFEPHPAARGADAAIAPDGFALDLGGDGGARALWAGPALEARDDDGQRERWAAFDLAHGLPRLTASQAEQWTPQQLSLERLHAYSVKKGCYPGQEIVARTHFLGQAKRGLSLFQSAAPLAPGDRVHDADDRAIGTVVSSAAADAHALALAVLPLDGTAGALSAGGHALRPAALSAGLGR